MAYIHLCMRPHLRHAVTPGARGSLARSLSLALYLARALSLSLSLSLSLFHACSFNFQNHDLMFSFIFTQVVHHTNKHSTRYAVDYSHKNALAAELRKGAAAISEYTRKQR
jgi:hypothetical protein